jgi:hypothetical protein
MEAIINRIQHLTLCHMKKIVNIVLVFFCLTNYCFGQDYGSKNDSIKITLSFTKHQLNSYRIPIFINENFFYTYSLSNDTLRIEILPSIDTLYVRNEKFIYFDNICTKARTQIMKIPFSHLKNIKYLLIESKYMKSYFFLKKQKAKNHFVLKCIY